MSERVHFIYLGGEFLWPHRRAIATAKVHGAPITVWCSEEPVGQEWASIQSSVQVRELDARSYLDHPIGLANIKDRFAWEILHEHGGLYLDLDTISLKPCWDLLTRDVCISYEHDPHFTEGHPYNSAVVIARQGADALADLKERSELLLAGGASRWGTIGPHLLTDVVADRPDEFDIAPFGVLNGWRDGTIINYYNGQRPTSKVRVAHLFSSSRFHLFAADRWMP